MTWVIPIVTAIAGAVQQNQQNQKAKKVLNGQKGLINEQIQTSRDLKPYGMRYLQDSEKSFAPVLQHYLALASGDRGEAMRALAPQIQDLNNGYQNGLQQLAEMYPRVGARASLLANLPFRQADAVNNLISRSREGAFTGLAGLGSTFMSGGGALAGSSLNGLAGASGQQNGLLNSLLAMQNQQNQSSAGVGAALADGVRGYQQWRAGQAAPAAGGGGTTTSGWLTGSQSGQSWGY